VGQGLSFALVRLLSPFKAKPLVKAKPLGLEFDGTPNHITSRDDQHEGVFLYGQNRFNILSKLTQV